MDEDRLSELLGCRWKGSYLQRDKNTVLFDAEHFYENSVFQIIFHVRKAKESSTVIIDIKRQMGDILLRNNVSLAAFLVCHMHPE